MPSLLPGCFFTHGCRVKRGHGIPLVSPEWQHKMRLGRLSSILYACMYEGTYVWPLFVHSRIGPAGLGLCFSRKKLRPFKIRSKIVHAQWNSSAAPA